MKGQIQHLVPERVFGYLHSRPEGLSGSEVEERLLEVGPNSVEVRDRWRWTRSLVKQFSNFFALLLIASALLCFWAEGIQPGQSMAVLGWALIGVALLNAIFSFVQEYRAEKAMEALRDYLPQMVEVRRKGALVRIPIRELVPGDLICLAEGDRVPADARVVRCHEMLVNNAPLTGEAKAVKLTEEPSEAEPLESPNLVFAGCSVLKGRAEAVVFATGLRTEFGKLAHLSQAIRRAPSPLERETVRMVRVLTVIAVSMGVSFFLYGLVSGRPLWINLVFMMGIIVANVPEGLLPTFTLALAMGSLRMAKKNVLVKGLSAVEALGAVHVICTDKTGTLTLNRLSVTRTSLPLGDAEAKGEAPDPALLELAACAGQVERVEGRLSGDPLDVAVAEALLGRGGSLPEAARSFAFDAELRRAAGVCSVHGRDILVVKGAWESLRPMIARVLDAEGQSVEACEEMLEQASGTLKALAASGLRVIAVAWRQLEASEAQAEREALERNLTLAGFLGVEDPVRPEVPEAVARCRSAGIDVIMITGDHPDTALAVARRCGILEPGGGEALTGDRLARLSEAQLVERLDRGLRVFARSAPDQKMKIVSALKAMNLVVAMTGDGVNDAPALKAADVGVAMGKAGTEVARASAQIILLDDNFASIVAGVEEGRCVFGNIRKFTNYVLASNVPEILPYLLYILLPVPLALTIIQILSVDLGTDIVPSMALGQEPPDPEAMKQPPRRRDAGLLDRPLLMHSYLFLGLIEAIWSLLLFFLVLHQGGWQYGTIPPETDPLYRSATGMALSSVLLMQVGNLLGRRCQKASGLDRGVFRNRLMLIGVALEVFFSWALLYQPQVSRVMATGPVPLHYYGLAWLGIPLIFGLDYLRKRLTA